MTTKILNNVDHKDLRIRVRPATACGGAESRALIFTTEYSDLHKQVPILIYKDPETGECSSHVVLGFEKGENLFVENGEWQIRHIPATMARGPFSIGYRHQEEDGTEAPEALIMVDENDPRCNVADGEAVFLEFGGEAPYLRYIKKVLTKIEIGMHRDYMFFSLLEQYDLLEPVSIRVDLTAEMAVGFNGFNTINKENLRGLNGEMLQRLNKAGVLGLIFFLISSLDNFDHMIDIKNSKTINSKPDHLRG